MENNADNRKGIFRDVIESVYDGIIVIDKEFNIIYANERFASIYSKHSKDIIGKKCTELVAFDHCKQSCPHRDIIARKSEFSGHSLYCQKHAVGPYCVSASPLLDENDNVIGVVELYRNMKQLGMYIGSLEETNITLQQEKERLHNTLDEIADGYYLATPDGRITSVNQKLQKLLGKNTQQLVGKKCRDTICGEACKEDCPLDWAVEHKQNVINSHQLLEINGDLLPYDKSIIVVEDNEGEIESVIGIISNVSEAIALREKADGALEYFDIITKNREMQEMLDFIAEVAPTDAPILLTGETGTGKELVASAIQRLSNRSENAFVKINCSALTESLLESELFGHAKGAFTGAVASYAGKFKKADKGTILLDEIEEMSPGLQAKLLRVLEAQEFEPVGSNRLEKVNVRIIAATNENLPDLIETGKFRADLYYRLNVIRIEVPPLRQRKEDIPVLIDYRLAFLRKKYNKEINAVSTRGMSILLDNDWPGNIRQLFGALEYAFLRAKSSRIERSDLPDEIYSSISIQSSFGQSGDNIKERQEIESLLKLYPKDRRRIAFELGISRTTLWRKIRELGLRG